MTVLLVAAAACSKADNANSNANTAPANKNSTANTSNTSTSSTSPSSSPIAAYKAFQEANRRKDYEAVKKSFSKASLEMITEEAKQKNQTLDEYVKEQVDRSKSDEVVDNEKITGDMATVDLKDKDGRSSITLPMVMEDGAWKIAYDKFMKKMEEDFKEMGKRAQQPSDNSNSNNSNDDK
ncbi:MAG: hypothetical protein ICV68_09720 [Pyrinomonadaceae bacterium]|nr:hypothetical protein [Pyrinomonadaceae bacterium]